MELIFPQPPLSLMGKGTVVGSREETGKLSVSNAVSSPAATLRLEAEGLAGGEIRSLDAFCALRFIAAASTSILMGMLEVPLGIAPRFFLLSGSGEVGDSPMRKEERARRGRKGEREREETNE